MTEVTEVTDKLLRTQTGYHSLVRFSCCLAITGAEQHEIGLYKLTPASAR
jgi:hypothetical protein